MDPLLIVVIFALLATVAALLLGLMSMSGGGAVDDQISTSLMWVRVGLQGFVVLLLVAAVLLR